MVGEVAAAYADGVDLLHVFRDGHEFGHRAEGLAQIVGVQAGDDDPHTPVGQGLDDVDRVSSKNCASSMPTTWTDGSTSSIRAGLSIGWEMMLCASCETTSTSE